MIFFVTNSNRQINVPNIKSNENEKIQEHFTIKLPYIFLNEILIGFLFPLSQREYNGKVRVLFEG